MGLQHLKTVHALLWAVHTWAYQAACFVVDLWGCALLGWPEAEYAWPAAGVKANTERQPAGQRHGAHCLCTKQSNETAPPPPHLLHATRSEVSEVYGLPDVALDSFAKISADGLFPHFLWAAVFSWREQLDAAGRVFGAAQHGGAGGQHRTVSMSAMTCCCTCAQLLCGAQTGAAHGQARAARASARPLTRTRMAPGVKPRP